MEVLLQWLNTDGAKDDLLIILHGFDFGLDTCPPSYLRVLLDTCHALHSLGEHTESLKWYQLLWTSFEKHRHDCEVPSDRWFEAFEEYVSVLRMSAEWTDCIHLAGDFRTIMLTDFGSMHHFYVRASIELAKCLEIDEFRYHEAACIYEEICGYEVDAFEEHEIVAGLIEIARYRLSVLFESHADLMHKAESFFLEAFHGLKLQSGCSHAKVLVSLTKIIEYYQKQNRRTSTTAAIKVIEEYIVELLIEERDEETLFEIALSITAMYRQLSSVEVGIRFLELLKEELVTGEEGSGRKCYFDHDQRASLDRRCFVFIRALGQLLCGYEREGMLDKIIREAFEESCLYEAWSAAQKSSLSIHVRLVAGARLLTFLELKSRQAEILKLRKEMWEMFRSFCSYPSVPDSLWQLFELCITNVTKKVVPISLLERLVNVTLELFERREFDASLEFLRWSQIFFKQLGSTKHSRAIELAFKISGALSTSIGHDRLQSELQRISSEILVEVLRFGQPDIDFGGISVLQLNIIIRLLGEKKNYTMLEVSAPNP